MDFFGKAFRELGFGVGDSVETPGEGGDFAEEGVLDGGAGAELVVEFLLVAEEAAGVFGFEEGGFGAEAVGLGVLAGFGFAFLGAGAGGFLGVGFVGVDSGLGGGGLKS